VAISMAGNSPSHPQMNVTPLIDVLLVLIIIFMFIVSISKRQGLEAQIPQPATNADREPEGAIVIALHLNAGDSMPLLKINNEDVSWRDLQAKLQKIYASRAERVAFVQSDGEVDFQYVADVIDQAKGAGVYRVGLMPKQ
jgi:biopolymer transport protein TolR